jgi:atrial natriuretic peptide receptor A
VVRGGPYESVKSYMTLTQILDRVAAHDNPPFRPLIGERDCPSELVDLMEKCWNDNADERPSFANIRTTVSCIMK